jgi:hypothetical protein
LFSDDLRIPGASEIFVWVVCGKLNIKTGHQEGRLKICPRIRHIQSKEKHDLFIGKHIVQRVCVGIAQIGA